MTLQYRHWTHGNTKSHPHCQPHQCQPATMARDLGLVLLGHTGVEGHRPCFQDRGQVEPHTRLLSLGPHGVGDPRSAMVHTQDSSELAFGPSLALVPKHSGANKCLVGKPRGCFVIHQTPFFVSWGTTGWDRDHSVRRRKKKQLGPRLGDLRPLVLTPSSSYRDLEWGL